MNLMGCRLLNLKTVYSGFIKTGIPLIGWDGSNFSSVLTGDDIGIYVLIPKLAKFLNISLECSIDLFFYSLLLLPFFIALYFSWHTYEMFLQRIIALTGLALLARFAYAVGDVYLCMYASAMSIIPLSYYMTKKNTIGYPGMVILSISVGFLSGLMHYVRSCSAAGPLLIMAALIGASSNYDIRRKVLIFSFALFGMISVACYFNMVHRNSVRYGAQELGFSWTVENTHVFWHQIYLGFGLLEMSNRTGIRYEDGLAVEKAKSINPNVIYYSQDYENILKTEVWKLFRDNWKLVFLTLFAKLGMLIYFFFKFANLGIIAAFLCRKPIVVDIAFALGFAFNALFPIIAIPLHEYALGFISCLTLWAIVSLNYAISKIDFVYIKRKLPVIGN